MTLLTTIATQIFADGSSPLDLVTVLAQLEQKAQVDLGNGTGSGQADRYFSDRRTLAASATEDLDLAGGLTDAFGNVITFAKIKAVYVRAATANANDVVIGGAAANVFQGWFDATTHKEHVPPNGWVLHVHPGTGWTVTAGTGDLLRLANGGAGTSVTYDIVIVGST